MSFSSVCCLQDLGVAHWQYEELQELPQHVPAAPTPQIQRSVGVRGQSVGGQPLATLDNLS